MREGIKVGKNHPVVIDQITDNPLGIGGGKNQARYYKKIESNL